MFCPIRNDFCHKECALWDKEDKRCAVRLAAEALTDLSALLIVSLADKTDEQDDEIPVEEDLPFC